MQPKGYIKDMKWLGKSLWVYSIKMQYENCIKSDGCCSCYTCLPQSSPTAQTALKTVAAPGTSTPPKDQRLLTIATPKQGPAHTHTCKQRQTLRNSTTIHKNSKQN